MSCTASVCRCGDKCGTRGSGDHEAASKRASSAAEQDRKRALERAMQRDLVKG